MTKSAIVERIVVGLIVGYFALGANNEINLERADTVAASTPAVKTIYDGVEFASQHEASIYKLEAFRDGWFPWGLDTLECQCATHLSQLQSLVTAA